jgi:glutamate racemase
MSCKGPIGVIDSGTGGLTLVRELVRLYPGEDVVSFGDSANCPYGSRPPEEILDLNANMLRFLKTKGVKAVAVACNTTSSMLERLSARVDIPLFGIVSPVARAVAQSGLSRLGVYATEVTVSAGVYTRLIQAENPGIEVFCQSSINLAAMVEHDANDDAIAVEITEDLGGLIARESLSHVILGCTHYPIREDIFRRCFPGVTFINPASYQAQALGDYLREEGLLNPQAGGRLSVYTSGCAETFRKVLARLDIPDPCLLESVSI